MCFIPSVSADWFWKKAVNHGAHGEHLENKKAKGKRQKIKRREVSWIFAFTFMVFPRALLSSVVIAFSGSNSPLEAHGQIHRLNVFGQAAHRDTLYTGFRNAAYGIEADIAGGFQHRAARVEPDRFG